MSEVALRRTGDFAYREALPDGGADAAAAPVLCVHGFPETSYMWRHVLEAAGFKLTATPARNRTAPRFERAPAPRTPTR